MPNMKIIKTYCKKSKKYYCVEMQQFPEKWQAINFVDLTEEQAGCINSELNSLDYVTSDTLLACDKCGKRNIASCNCAKRSSFCADDNYFFQCVYCKDLSIVSPEANEKKILVTSPRYDDIGKVLKSIGLHYKPYTGQFDCDMLFINCGTSDTVDPKKLNSFVKNGGCAYASDLTDTLINTAFSGLYKFKGHQGEACKIDAEVIDPELYQISGNIIKIEFDLNSWAILENSTGKTLLRAAKGSKYAENQLWFNINMEKDMYSILVSIIMHKHLKRK